MKLLVVKAWLALVSYDLAAKVHGYRTVQQTAQREIELGQASQPQYSPSLICDAVEVASVLYFKQVHCLQRSSVTAKLLRSAGWNAHLVIGVQMTPFASHAWVELEGIVVNDKPYMRQKYRVLSQATGGLR